MVVEVCLPPQTVPSLLVPRPLELFTWASLRCMLVHGGACWCMLVHGGAWWCIVAHAGAWWCMVVHCDLSIMYFLNLL